MRENQNQLRKRNADVPLKCEDKNEIKMTIGKLEINTQTREC